MIKIKFEKLTKKEKKTTFYGALVLIIMFISIYSPYSELKSGNEVINKVNSIHFADLIKNEPRYKIDVDIAEIMDVGVYYIGESINQSIIEQIRSSFTGLNFRFLSKVKTITFMDYGVKVGTFEQ